MEDLSKTIAEVKSALDQATHLIAENESLRAENKRLQESGEGSSPKRDLRIAQCAFEQGIESVFFQLRDNDFETEVDIDEQISENGFEVQFYKSLDVSIEVNKVIDDLYEIGNQAEIDDMLTDEVIRQVNEELALNEQTRIEEGLDHKG
jgi:hypothetical protein